MASPTFIGSVTTNNNSGAAETSRTFSYTVNSAGEQNRLLIGMQMDGVGAFTSSATYNGVSMTEIYRGPYVQVEAGTSLGLANPATGANNIVFNFSSSSQNSHAAMCLQDAHQTVAPDGNAQNNVSGTSLATSITTSTDGCLIFNVTGLNTLASLITQNSGQTERVNLLKTGVDAGRWFNVGTIPQVTAGAISTGITWTGTTGADQHAFGIKYLAPSAASSPANRRMLMGVG
ncbi:MAG: hypothetical protein WAV09_01120 [Minisyncoccia bacterium]